MAPSARNAKGRFVKGGARAPGGAGARGGKGKGPRKVNIIAKFDLIGDWEGAIKVSKAIGLDTSIYRAIRQEAALAERMVKQNLTQGGHPAGAPFAALSPWTVAARRLAKPSIKGTKPLMARGDMRNSVTHVVVHDEKRYTVAFVGLLRQAKGGKPGSEYMVNIGVIQEFGKTIVVRLTPKMIRFLGVLAKAAGKGRSSGAAKPAAGRRFLVIHIPARPFIRPAFALWSKDAGRRFQKRVAILTGGKYGRA